MVVVDVLLEILDLEGAFPVGGGGVGEAVHLDKLVADLQGFRCFVVQRKG
jgi:hypothetical protein